MKLLKTFRTAVITLFIVIPTKLLTANEKYLRICWKHMSAKPGALTTHQIGLQSTKHL